MTTAITTIAFDADDTLWHNEQLFRFTERQFADLLRDYADRDVLEKRLLNIEKKNLKLYGFGIKGFTLSMIETAIEVTEGRVPASIIKTILDSGRAMMVSPVVTLPGVHETLQALSHDYKLILVTKGDLFDQERKLAESGLGDFFTAVEVVTDKTQKTYETVFCRHGNGAGQSLMVGNSLRSDIIPALNAGAWGVYIPYEITWVLEEATEPVGMARYRHVRQITDVVPLLQVLN